MKIAEHFKKSQEQHQALSEHHGNLAAECEKAELDGMAKEHRACAKVHGERAMHYKAMAGAAAEKAVLDELAKGRAELQPSRVSAVAPPNLRAIPRTGAPSLEKVVDEEFAHLISSGDDRSE